MDAGGPVELSSIGPWSSVVIGIGCWPGWTSWPTTDFEAPVSVIRGTAAPAGKTVFVFPGQGSQWLGMGIELLDTAPVFAQQIEACAEAFAEFVDWSLTDVLRGAPGAPGLDRVDVVQPVLFAVMVSLAELWKSVGVSPDAVIGHSQGEIAAAYVAGALSLRDAARVVTLRSKLLRSLAGPGGMLSIACSTERARELLAPYGNRVSIAAVNGRSAVVVSGDVAALEELVALLRRPGSANPSDRRGLCLAFG